MLKTLDRYVLRELASPAVAGGLIILFVLLMNEVLLLAEVLIAKGVPVGTAARVFVLLLPSLVAFALPMAVLCGVGGGMARLTADSETTALFAAGIGPSRLARPVLLFGLCGWLLASPLALWIAPWANHAWVRTMTDSVLARVRLRVNPLEFNESIPHTVFFVRSVEPGNRWRDVFVFLSRGPATPRLIMARTGTVRFVPGEKRAVLDLVDGLAYSGPDVDPDKDSLTEFERLEEGIDVEALFGAASRDKGVREKDIRDLSRDLGRLLSDGGELRVVRLVRAHRVEIQKKLSLPFACLVFALVGLPLGLASGRSGRLGGFSLSLVLVVLYYAILTVGEKAALDGRISAGLAMWAPDIAIAALAGLLSMARRSGRGPTSVLRTAFRKERKPAMDAAPSGRRTSAGTLEEKRRPFEHPGAPRFPRTLDRYIGRKFLAIFGLSAAVLALSAFLAVFLERLSDVLRLQKPVHLLLRYAWFKMPELAAYLLPVAVLASALLSIGLLARTSETTAMKAAGVSAYRIALPVVALAGAVGLAAFLIQERITPAARSRSEEAWARAMDLPPRTHSYVNRHWILSRSGTRIYHYDYFDARASTFGRLSVFDIDVERWALLRRTFAERAALDGDTLVLSDGWTRTYGPPAGQGDLVRAATSRLAVEDGRDAFLKVWKEPLQMTLAELRRYADEVRSLGFSAARLRTELGERTALPFVSLVMALLAVPFGFTLARRGVLVGSGLSLGLAMAYWGVFALFRSLGYAEILPPVLAAWGANVLFALAGVWLVLRLRT